MAKARKIINLLILLELLMNIIDPFFKIFISLIIIILFMFKFFYFLKF